MKETLHTCPNCGRSNFTAKGLAAHKCKPAKTELAVVVPDQEKLAKLPVAGITGTWDGARRWRNGAVAMEQGKLFCQVMLGFELIELRAALPSESGKRSDLTSSQVGTRWEELLEKELKLSKTSAYRMMQMADECKKRLKKLPELRDFDPTATAFAELPEAQATALTSAVKKLTDGATQTSFMQELGLAKDPGAGAGRKAGDGGRPPAPSFAEQAAAMKAAALGDLQDIGVRLEGYKAAFTLLDEPDCRTLESLLERHLKAVRLWLSKPAAERDPKAIEALFAE